MSGAENTGEPASSIDSSVAPKDVAVALKSNHPEVSTNERSPAVDPATDILPEDQQPKTSAGVPVQPAGEVPVEAQNETPLDILTDPPIEEDAADMVANETTAETLPTNDSSPKVGHTPGEPLSPSLPSQGSVLDSTPAATEKVPEEESNLQNLAKEATETQSGEYTPVPNVENSEDLENPPITGDEESEGKKPIGFWTTPKKIAALILGLLLLIGIIVGTVLLLKSRNGGSSSTSKEKGEIGMEDDGKFSDYANIPRKLTFEGPDTSVDATPNPFTDYAMKCSFLHLASKEKFEVNGFYAADGKAADSEADSGDKWRCIFAPSKEGKWNYTVSMRSGPNIALSNSAGSGKNVQPDGESGTLIVGPTPSSIPKTDFRRKGHLQYVGRHFYQFSGSEEYFLAGGTDSPEGLLNYDDFTGNPSFETTKSWKAHEKDWKSGDPTWNGGKGKGLIGAVNYVASRGLNAMSFLFFTHLGVDRGVFPNLSVQRGDSKRYNVAKLEQWEKVFTHMDVKGIMMHIKLQEVQSVKFHDNGELGDERSLYYKEMAARFGHHNALV